MQNRSLCHSLAALSLGVLLMTPLCHLTAAPSVTAPLLAQTDGQSSTPPSPTALFRFGKRSVLDTSPITHTFLLRSSSDKPITIIRLQPSCRCTTAIVEGAKDEAPPFTLAPGQQARVRVVISPGDALPGPFEKEVYVFAAGDTVPTATLQMAGDLTPPVTFLPAALDFGRVTAKDARSLMVTVFVDKRLLSPGQTIRLRCDNPDILITKSLGPSFPSIAKVFGVFETYNVELSPHARPGPLRATVSVAPGAGVAPAFGTDAWGTASVTGEITGVR